MQVARHSIFDRCVRVCDVIQRIYMRGLGYISPTKDCHTVFGSVIRCRTRQFVQRRIRFFGIFEHNLTYYTLNHLREGDLYLDIGANVGYFSLLASRCVGPAGKVISVEADPETFRELITNLELNRCRNVVARNIAAAETACKVTIERVRNNSGANSTSLEKEGSVDGVPFREIVGDDLGRLRFIKIDIEGSEEPILRAILSAASDLPDSVIIASEVSPSSAEHVARFADAGFRAFAIQNIYTIDYYLIRSYLARYGEDKAVHMIPLNSYNPSYRDYIFERSGVIPACGTGGTECLMVVSS